MRTFYLAMAVGGALVAMSSLWWWADRSAFGSQEQHSTAYDSDAEQVIKVQGTSGSPSHNSKATKLKTFENRHQGISPSDRHDIKMWKARRGYFSEGKRAEYESYDTAAILQLAGQGDLLALQMASEKAFLRGDIEAALGFNYEAAARGSTQALVATAELFLMLYKGVVEGDRSKSTVVDKIRNVALAPVDEDNVNEVLAANVVAYYEAAVERGDEDMSRIMRDHFLRQLDEESREAAAGKGKTLGPSIVAMLEQVRRDRGFHSFENDAPDLYRRLYKGVE